jgi:hypothetical protein
VLINTAGTNSEEYKVVWTPPANVFGVELLINLWTATLGTNYGSGMIIIAKSATECILFHMTL